MRKLTRSLIVAPALGLMVLMPATAALADEGHGTRATLDSLNDSGATGNAMVNVNGTTITVEMMASGLLADQPHAAHIHYGEEARNECPTVGKDDKDSLTTTGDTSPKSALDVKRFDTAKGGNLSYKRGSITVTEDLAADIKSGEAVVVIHGVDYDGDGKYSGDKKSELDPALPTEATDPAACGVLVSMAKGGAETGAGASQADSDATTGVFVGGVFAMLGGLALAARRRFATPRS